MGLRFRKSFKLPPGVRLNVGSGGMSWSLGPRGASVSYRSCHNHEQDTLVLRNSLSAVAVLAPGIASSGCVWQGIVASDFVADVVVPDFVADVVVPCDASGV
jgi:hypothetical protein